MSEPRSPEEEPQEPGKGEPRLTLRHIVPTDYRDISRIMEQVYAKADGAWSRRQFTAQLNRFPEGQICIEDNGRVVAAALSLIVQYHKFGDDHTHDEITGHGYLTTHDPQGDVLYGMDIIVAPEYQGMRLGRRLYDARKELCQNLNLRAIVAGGRLPGLSSYPGKTPQEYIALVQRREIYDPILTFQLANGFHVIRVLKGYWPQDRESRAYATLLRWDNIYYEPESAPLIGHREPVVRLGTVQWQLRRIDSVEEFVHQVEFFVDSLAAYGADFALFPEYSSAPLLAQFQQQGAAEAMRGLAGYTEQIRDAVSKLAVSYNINIIVGSMPIYADQKLYNVSYLLRRDGTRDAQYKIHITPDERSYWGVVGGRRLRVFETDVGRIAILVCYDIEFPELARVLAERGAQIVFVPFCTDTQNGYYRVRRCAQARAIENECFVAITGGVGSMPEVENMDIQFSQTAVFSPSDFAFPSGAVMAEGIPNAETTLLVDVDLDTLKELRTRGTVRNYQDRRRDLYRVDWLGHEGD